MSTVSPSLFLLSTASQAFFLSHTPQLVNDSVLIITVRSRSEADKIRAYVDCLNWEKIFVWYIPGGKSKLEYAKLLKIRMNIFLLKLKYPVFDRIFIGSYVNLMHLSVLAEYEGQNEIFLLYDGLQMVVNNSERKNDYSKSISNYPPFYKFLQFKKPEVQSLTFVTPLPLKVNSADSIYLISRVGSSKKICLKKRIYFIGQPLSRFGIISNDFYLDCLRLISKKYSGYEIFYYPHPREGEELLKSIDQIFHVQNLQNEVFEEHFLKLQDLPEKVISFYSSVLVNLLFFEAQVELISIEIPPEEILIKKFQPSIQIVYDYFYSVSNKKLKVLKPGKDF